MSLKTLLPSGLALLAGSATCFGQSVWLPEQKQFKVTPGFSFSKFDEFWAGDKKVSNPPNGDNLKQYTGYIALEYGIIENLAADVTVGYTATSTDAFGGNASDDGLLDTSLGVRYRLVDEHNARYTWLPTLAVRVGGVIPGTYDENKPFSAGDGAYGFESSLLFGKAFGQTGLGVYGDIGFRVRENPTPNEFFGTAGAYYQIGPVTLAAGYRHIQSVSGIDIGGADFNPALGKDHGFPATKEINQIIEGGITFTDRGGRNYQFSVGSSVDGRNTGDKLIFGFNITLPFGGH